jgi:hypothetical protein
VTTARGLPVAVRGRHAPARFVSTGWPCQVQRRRPPRRIETVTEQLRAPPVVHADDTETRVTPSGARCTGSQPRCSPCSECTKSAPSMASRRWLCSRASRASSFTTLGPYEALDNLAHARCHVHLVRRLPGSARCPARSSTRSCVVTTRPLDVALPPAQGPATSAKPPRRLDQRQRAWLPIVGAHASFVYAPVSGGLG